MAEQLWSDERIENRLDTFSFVERNDIVYVDYGEVADFIEDEVRDDLQAALDAANETVAELQDALDGMRGIAQQRQKRVEELEAQLAKTWQPVEDGLLPEFAVGIQTRVVDDGRRIWQQDSVTKSDNSIYLPTELGYRLCRRVEKEQP